MANNNEFTAKRVAKGAFTVVDAATTHSTGVIIPAGAIITNITLCAPSAVTIAGASATVAPRVGTFAAASTKVLSTCGAQTVPVAMTLLTAGGVYVPTSGELNVIQQASSSSAATGTWNIYVDYIYV